MAWVADERTVAMTASALCSHDGSARSAVGAITGALPAPPLGGAAPDRKNWKPMAESVGAPCGVADHCVRLAAATLLSPVGELAAGMGGTTVFCGVIDMNDGSGAIGS